MLGAGVRRVADHAVGGDAVDARAEDRADRRLRVQALTDVTVLLQIAQIGDREHGVPLNEGGLHAGEWETSMLLSIRPDLIRMDRAQAGFTGDPQEALAGLFAAGVKSISDNGALGDPTQATAEHGERYWAAAVDLVVDAISSS